MSSHRTHMISFTSASHIRSSPLSHNLPTPFISHCTRFCLKSFPHLSSLHVSCSHSQDDIPVLGRPFHALCSSFRLSGVRTEGNSNRSSQVTVNAPFSFLSLFCLLPTFTLFSTLIISISPSLSSYTYLVHLPSHLPRLPLCSPLLPPLLYTSLIYDFTG